MIFNCPQGGRFRDVVNRIPDLTQFGALRAQGFVKVEYLIYCGNCDDFETITKHERER